jgi:hypothetical protein
MNRQMKFEYKKWTDIQLIYTWAHITHIKNHQHSQWCPPHDKDFGESTTYPDIIVKKRLPFLRESKFSTRQQTCFLCRKITLLNWETKKYPSNSTLSKNNHLCHTKNTPLLRLVNQPSKDGISKALSSCSSKYE